MDTQVYRDIGALQADVKTLKDDNVAINSKLDTLLERSAQQRGARGMLWKVGGASGTAGGVLAALLQWWTDRG